MEISPRLSSRADSPICSPTETVEPRRLVTVETETGTVLSASIWVDGTYEGDLAAVAGATMTWGRESVAQYNESGAGRGEISLKFDVDPYWPDGSVIPHVSSAPLVPVGEADKRIEVYDFRLCVTNSPGHRVPFPRPKHYNASEVRSCVCVCVCMVYDSVLAYAHIDDLPARSLRLQVGILASTVR